jgi:hypothetical protein
MEAKIKVTDGESRFRKALKKRIKINRVHAIVRKATPEDRERERKQKENEAD